MRRLVLLALPSLLVGTVYVVSAPTSAVAASGAALRPTARTIAATLYDTIFIGGDGRVYGVGRNEFGEITGTGQRTEPAPLTGLPAGVRATSVAAAVAHTLVLGSNGVVYGTGSANSGELTGTSASVSTLTKLSGLPTGIKATAIAAGGDASLVLGSNGTVYGTGDNSSNQLTGSEFEITTLTPLSGMGGVKAVAIAAGIDESVVLGADGRVYGAGQNNVGQLTGTPSLTTIKTLTPFSNLPFGIHIVAMAASETNVVMLGSDDVAYATGGNSFGQLGQGATDDDPHSTPTALPVSDVVGIASTSSAIGLIRKSGTVVAAGDNTYTPLTGTTQPVVRFQPLAMSASVPATGTGAELVLDSVTAIVRDSLGIVYGAGDNTYGQLTGTVPSDPSLVVLGGQKVLNTGTPTVTGTVKVGRTLTAHVGSWEVSATRYSYQWLRNGAAIHAATKATYKLVRADKRKKISVRVTGSRTGFTTGTATSASRGPVAKAKR